VNGFRYDEIGYWSEIKLDIVRKYATAYSTVMSTQASIKKYIYIDAFAGAGWHISRRTGEFVAGSPLNALAVQPPFREFHLIDLDGGKAEELRGIAAEREGVFVYEGDANRILLEKVFPRCRYEDFRRALCLLDPYALNVDWNVLQTAGQMKSIEVFYNFMIMDANMNVFWHHPEKVASTQVDRMNRVWGDDSWREVVYRRTPTLFGDRDEKAENEVVAEAFRKRLQEVAGFKYVPQPMPMRNQQGAVVYYLFFASPNKTGAGIVDDIFNVYRKRGMK
jgi:three-Cys-motif partner protein